MFNLSDSSLKNLVGVHPRLVDVMLRAIQITRVDFGIPSTGGMRTDQTQYDLFMAHKSKADGITIKSKHQANKDTGFSHAVDFFPYVDGNASYHKAHLALVACAVFQAASELGVKVEWGGLWSTFVDMPHFQLAGE